MRSTFLTAFLVGFCLSFYQCAHAGDMNVYSQLNQSVVRLTDQTESSGGTGFIVLTSKNKRFTVTNAHVCEHSPYLYAYRHADFTQLKLRVVAVDELNDLCALEAAPGLAIKYAKGQDKFTALYIVGHPLLRHATPSFGRIVGPLHIEFNVYCDVPPAYSCRKGYEVIDTTIQVFPGNSGSAVSNHDFQLMGVINSVDGSTGWATMIPLKAVKNFLDKL